MFTNTHQCSAVHRKTIQPEKLQEYFKSLTVLLTTAFTDKDRKRSGTPRCTTVEEDKYQCVVTDKDRHSNGSCNK